MMNANAGTAGSETAQSLRLQVEKVSSLLDAAFRHVTEGRSVDLTPLESKVAVMCDAIHQAKPDARTGLKSPMKAILDKLDKLEARLTERQKLAEDADKGSLRQHALDAYRRPQGGNG